MRKFIHHFFWAAARFFRFIDIRRFGIKYEENEPEPKEAFVLLANHTFYYDGFFLGYGIKKPVIFLSTDEIPFGEQVGGRILRCLYTEKGTPDVNVVVQMRKLLEQGESVGLFPEGDRCWDGQTDKLNPNLPRLLKAFKAPVRLAHLSGSYLSGPRWADNDRHGKISVRFENLSVDKIMSMDDEALYGYLTEKLSCNDIKNPELRSVRFKGKKMAEGIHNLLWLCPECGEHDTVYGEGDTIVCRSCRSEWLLDGWCSITPRQKQSGKSPALCDIQDWSDWQHQTIDSWISSPETGQLLTGSENIEFFRYSHKGRGMRYGGRKYRSLGKGRMELYRDTWRFVPVEGDSEVFDFKTEEITCFVEGLNEKFSFHYHGERYRIDIPRTNALKYFHFLRHRTGFYCECLSCS